MSANDANSVVQCYGSEPLYLLAEENNKVYVDNFLLEQHQIDGLRFLFNQFNKKSPGVIVNFPPSCGKSATVAIFLNAVTNVLKNPVLILCKDDSALQYWKEILLKWSSYVEDHIAVEASNPFIKGKKVFLKKRENLYSYLRRRWSIIIIKENIVSKDVFKLAFEADFKMCITATDIKKDASLLTAVYNWLYPKSKVNINDFVAKENHPREKFRKSVQLDLILEDVAIRRYLNLKPFHTERADNVTEIETNLTEDETNHRKGPSKNKDATGTKVKRSKITAKDGLVKQLIASLGLNSDCEEIKKTINENNNELNECIDFDKTLIKEESTESLSLGSNSIVDQNEIRNDINILKEKPAESLNLCTNSKVDQNEMKDLHNKTVLQKQLIESLGLDDVKPEIKDEENDDQNNISKNIQNAVQQIATDPEDDGIIKIKIESEDGNETNTERSVNNVSNKRKSDKDLDCKILDMEEKALKKFKGSFLDSIF
ncbi:uncharacterized protein LOC123871643 isoform X4 [Maniola jurtina]|uniref:uncharacterized protein LOC123871643 isoform X4 n=1 Tax=Maniola jurtina TaxID=191418 RepID=UPI001E688E4A|nr:uncharacterized protein LOC123871643 isoform X4 [Maniola jurtina]